MKIIIINPNQFGYDVGYLHYVEYLSRENIVDYVCYDSNKDRIPFNGRNIYYYTKPQNHLGRLKSIIEVGNIIKNGAYDIVLFRNMKYAFLIRFAGRTKSIYDLRTVSIANSTIKRAINNQIIKLNVSCFEKIFTISPHIVDYLKIQHKDVSIVPLGGKKYFDRKENKIKSLKCIYSGTLDKRRIYDTIIGFIIFCKRFPSINVSYTIIGTGRKSELDKIKACLDNIPENLQVALKGYIPNNELGEYYRNHYLGISYVPLVDYFYPQPVTKTYEYLLSGMVVIATALPSNKDVINSNNGILIKDNPEAFAEGISYIFQNLSVYDPQQIQKSSSHFNWQNIIKNSLIPRFS